MCWRPCGLMRQGTSKKQQSDSVCSLSLSLGQKRIQTWGHPNCLLSVTYPLDYKWIVFLWSCACSLFRRCFCSVLLSVLAFHPWCLLCPKAETCSYVVASSKKRQLKRLSSACMTSLETNLWLFGGMHADPSLLAFILGVGL